MTPAPTLAITALSPVATAAAFCRLAGVLWATVVVKATFQLVHGEAARAVEPLELVTADRAAAPGTSLLQARETAPHLPNAGVVLAGHACAPEGRAVPSMSVRLGLSRERPLVDKTLHVFGARAAANPGAIAPFQKMPLVYERAHGGAGVWENPVGTGGPGSTVLPNIVDPKDPRRPAGFAPVAPQWAPRRALLRGIEPAALDAAILDVPAGFDWRFFQAAPADQQMDRLHGDEWIVLDGIDAALPRLQSRLPQVSARARRDVTDARGAAAEHAVDLRADMLVIDADRRLASLIWRGRFAVESMEALDRVRVIVGLEQPGRSIAWPAPVSAAASGVRAPDVAGPTAAAPKAAPSTATTDIDLAALLGGKMPFSPDRESQLPPQEPAARAPSYTGTAAVDLKSILQGGAAVPFPSTGPDAAAPPKAVSLDTGTTDIDLGQLLKGAALHSRSAKPADAPPAPATTAGTPFTAAGTPTTAAELPDTPAGPTPTPVTTPATPTVSPVASAELPVTPDGTLTTSASTPPSPIARAAVAAPAPAFARTADAEAGRARKTVLDKVARKEPLDGDNLAGANLSGLDLSGASLARCDLRGAKLRGARLAGANLRGATLDEADLRGAVLEGAQLDDASLIKAELERANMVRCSALRADLTEANLLGADLTGGGFAEASLARAVLRDARAAGADFTRARLDGADARSASLRGARLERAVLAGADLERADLQNANLQNANLRGAKRRMTRLAGADLTGADHGEPAGAPIR